MDTNIRCEKLLNGHYPFFPGYRRENTLVPAAMETIFHKSNYMSAYKHCLACGALINGRSDKKFCTDHCRNKYHNKQKEEDRILVRDINTTLNRNRRILAELLQTASGKGSMVTDRETLLQHGFQFKYITHMHLTQGGKPCSYCYEYGYVPVEKDLFVLVKQRVKKRPASDGGSG